LVLLLPVSARGDDHWFDTCGAYSRAKLSWLDGGRFTVTVPLGEKKPKRVNLVFDYSFENGLHEGASLDLDTYSAGARLTGIRKIDRTWLPFAQALVAYEERKGAMLDGNHWGFALGGGLEVVKRMQHRFGLGLRGQAEFVVMPGANDKKVYPRGGIGIVLRVGD
jgi:hypothetical protein